MANLSTTIKRWLLASGCAGLGAALTAFGVAAQRPAPPTGLELFSAMLPVFNDDRCMNCHGVVDPATGTQHAGGTIAGFNMTADGIETAGDLCFACHTEGRETVVEHVPADPSAGTAAIDRTFFTGPWKLAPGIMSFVGKDAGARCHQVKAMTGGDGTPTSGKPPGT